jgi:hypothetical protein
MTKDTWTKIRRLLSRAVKRMRSEGGQVGPPADAGNCVVPSRAGPTPPSPPAISTGSTPDPARQPVTRGKSGSALHSVSEPSYSRASSRPVTESAKRSTVAEMPPPQ